MRHIFIFLIKIYRLFLSPIFGTACRFEPTCSQYTEQALRRYGTVKGLALGVWRILRCNPFSRGGYDPVK